MSDENIIKVLIADDVTDTRESVKRMLQFDKSIEVVGTALNGRDAITQAVKLKPEVILMDVNMPDMDGITATEAILRKLPYVQVIILSVQNDADYMRRAMRAGAHDFLPKPPMIDELTATIRRGGEIAFEEKAKLDQDEARRIVADEIAFGGKQGKIIVIYSPKGGAGCTTIATNLAITTQLQNKESKVILIDGSLQYGDVSIFLKAQAKHSVADLALRADELDPEFVEDVVVKNEDFGLHILAAPSSPEMAEQVKGEDFVKTLQFLRQAYDYIFIDTNTYLSEVTLSAIEVADLTILITTQDIPSIKSSNSFLTLCDALGFSRDHISFVMNRFDKRITGVTPERVGESLRQEIILSIPFDEKNTVSESINRGVPLIPGNRAHPVAKGIITLYGLVRDKIKEFEVVEEEL